MPSIRGWPNQNQPLTEVLISGLFDGNSDLANHQFTALIDTGSTKTCITRTVVETLGFEPFTRILVATPSGLERRKAYTFTMGFVSHADDAISEARGAYFFPDPVLGAVSIGRASCRERVCQDV